MVAAGRHRDTRAVCGAMCSARHGRIYDRRARAYAERASRRVLLRPARRHRDRCPARYRADRQGDQHGALPEPHPAAILGRNARPHVTRRRGPAIDRAAAQPAGGLPLLRAAPRRPRGGAGGPFRRCALLGELLDQARASVRTRAMRASTPSRAGRHPSPRCPWRRDRRGSRRRWRSPFPPARPCGVRVRPRFRPR